jgi:hypothetical protein
LVGVDVPATLLPGEYYVRIERIWWLGSSKRVSTLNESPPFRVE